MGACYNVTLKVDFKDEDGAIKALNEHIKEDTGVDYSLEEYENIGVKPDTFDGLVKILLAHTQREVAVYQHGRFRIYDNYFDASYGWERVMVEWFNVLAPFLKDKSLLLIYPDSDYDKLIIKNGKCVQVH